MLALEERAQSIEDPFLKKGIRLIVDGTDPAKIGERMSLALITTLYGSILANWVCIPVSAKFRRSGQITEMQKEMIMEGVLSIQAGDNPMVIKDMMNKE